MRVAKVLGAIGLFVVTACFEHDTHSPEATDETSRGEQVDSVDLRGTSQALETALCGSTAGLQANAPWPMFGGCPTHAAQSSQYGPTTNQKNWSTYLSGNVKSSPTVAADSSIFVGSDAGRLFKINRATGAILKQALLSGPVQSSPAIGADGTVYVGTDLGKVYALDPSTLATKWSYSAAGGFDSSPAIGADGTVYIGSSNFSLYALNPNGTKKWSYLTGFPIVNSPAIGADGTIYIGSDVTLYALNPNGTKKWSKGIGFPITSSPALGRFGRVYIGGGDRLLSIDTANGNIIWQKSLGSITIYAPSIGANGVIYVGTGFSLSTGGSLYAVNPDGDILWHFDALGGVQSTPIIDKAGNIYFGADDNKVYALDPTGQQIWKFATLGNVRSSPALDSTGALVVGANDNQLYSIGAGATRVANGGACTSDAQCVPGLLCGRSNGARYGLAPTTRACWTPTCENKIKDPGETELDCGGPCGSCTNVCSLACTLGDQVQAPALEVLPFSKASFIRPTYGTFNTGAQTVALAGGNVLRFDDRGDGKGRLALFEGARTNRIRFSEQLGHSPEWRMPSGGTPIVETNDYAQSPVGDSTADRMNAPAGGYPSRTQTLGTNLPAGVLSAWLRLTTGGTTSSTRPVLADSQQHWYTSPSAWSLTGTWERRTMATTASSASVDLSFSHKAGWPGNATTFPQLGAADFLAWGLQLEEGTFASSYIPTTDDPETRAADRLVFESQDVPAWVRTALWQIDVAPIFANTDIATTDEMTIVAWENGQLTLGRDSAGGVLKITSGSTNYKLSTDWVVNTKLTITLDFGLHTLAVKGAKRGDGSISMGALAIPVGRLAVGARLDGTLSAFARVSELRRVGSTTVPCVADPDCTLCGDGAISTGEVCDSAADARCNATCSVAGDFNFDCNSCAPGQACPSTPNGPTFGLDYWVTVCAPTQLCMGGSSACGTTQSACGTCACEPSCAGKRCGDDPSDGCGGICQGLCTPGQPGSRRDTDCPAGYVSGEANSWRFGETQRPDESACWPAECEDFDPRRLDCGTVNSPCGLCDPLVADICPNGVMCAGSDEPCEDENSVRNEAGECLPDEPPSLKQRRVVPTDVGALPGSYAVSPAGSASYSVPVSLPPGRAGFAPAMRFEYNSNAGNGLVGFGWRLTGFSAITACTATIAQDGELLPNQANLCLDGDRLVLVGPRTAADGTQWNQWRTDPETFVEVLSPVPTASDPTPQYFVATYRNGVVATFGGDSGARLGGPVAVSDTSSWNYKAWGVTELRDRAGNSIKFSYSEGYVSPNKQLIPKWIGYNFIGQAASGNDAANEIIFTYADEGKRRPRNCTTAQTRPASCDDFRRDNDAQYALGVLDESQSTLISKIEIKALGATVRSYELSFRESTNELSLLRGITECATTSQGTRCRPTTQFVYDEANLSTPEPKGVQATFPFQTLSIEWNQDGYDDLAQFDGLKWKILFGGPNGLGSSAALINPVRPVTFKDKHGVVSQPAFVADLNGDSRDELIVQVRTSAGAPALQRYESSNSAEDVDIVWPPKVTNNAVFIPFDPDGDKLTDLLLCMSGSKGYLYKNTDGEMSHPIEAGAVEGCGGAAVANFKDGRQAIVFQNLTYLAKASDGTYTVKALPNAHKSKNLRLHLAADFNGDGLRDLLFLPTKGGVLAEVMLGDGNSWKPPITLNLPNLSVAIFVMATDYDRDGKSQLVYGLRSGSTTIWLQTSVDNRGANAVTKELVRFGADNIYPWFLDANGDSVTDMFAVGDGGLFLGLSPFANLLKEVRIPAHVNDVPDTVSFTYNTGVSASYTPSTNELCGGSTIFCSTRLPFPVVVESQETSYAQTPSAPGTPVQFSSARYAYSGSRSDKGGLGWIGFESRTAWLSGASGIEFQRIDDTYNLQSRNRTNGYFYPFAAGPEETTRTWTVPANDITRPATFEGRVKTTRNFELRTSAFNQPFIVTTDEATEMYEGELLTETLVQMEYDGYGNLLAKSLLWPLEGDRSEIIAYEPLYQREPARKLTHPDLVGRILRVSTAAGSVTISADEYDYDSLGLLKSISTKKLDSLAREGTDTTIERDQRNNPRLVTEHVPGSDHSTDRVWQYEWDATAGVYLADSLNPEFHGGTYVFSYSDGLLYSETDANRVESQRRYDGFGRLVAETNMATGVTRELQYSAATQHEGDFFWLS